MAEFCTICGKDMVRKSQDHHFVQCGLQNVTLVNWEGFDCDDCQRFTPIQPSKSEYEKGLVKVLLTKLSLLSGEEIIFLRNAIGMTSQQLADAIRIKHTRLSRIENGEETVVYNEDFGVRLCVLKGFNNISNGIETREVMWVMLNVSDTFLPGFRIDVWKTQDSVLEYGTYYSN